MREIESEKGRKMKRERRREKEGEKNGEYVCVCMFVSFIKIEIVVMGFCIVFCPDFRFRSILFAA